MHAEARHACAQLFSTVFWPTLVYIGIYLKWDTGPWLKGGLSRGKKDVQQTHAAKPCLSERPMWQLLWALGQQGL